MADQFLGEIRPVPFNFAPNGWALCNGQILSITQNQALFSLLGVDFGGNGVQTFALPNLQGKVALMAGQGLGLSEYVLGETGGSETVILTENEIPSHTHLVTAGSSAATQYSPQNAVPGVADREVYGSAAGQDGSPQAVSPAGQNAPHNNMQPFLTINYIIALVGTYPTRP